MSRSFATSFALAAVTAAALALSGCGGKTVTRIDADTTTDLSGRWNDTDSRKVSEHMIRECLSRPWLRRHQTNRGGAPVVIVGAVRNRTTEHIPVDTFIKDIERAFVNDGTVKVVADAGQRGDLRAEREAMQGNVTGATLKKFGREMGADYVLTGAIHQILDEEDGERVSFYQTDLELIDVETNEKVWLDSFKIKKFIARGRYSG